MYEHCCHSVNRVTSGLTVPLTQSQPGTLLWFGQAGEGNNAIRKAFCATAIWSGQHDSGEHVVPAAREEVDTKPCLVFGCGFGQDAPSHSDNGIGGKDKTARHSDRVSFCARHSLRVNSRRLGVRGRFVDIGRNDCGGCNANLRQEREAARTG